LSDALAAMLPIAAGIAISPIPITGVILMLLSDRAIHNALAVLAGWMAAIAAIVAVVTLVGGGAGADEEPATGFVVAQFVLAAILLAAATRRWRMRPKPGEPHDVPKWMGGLRAITPPRALALGLGLIFLNPKDALLSVAGGAELAEAEPSAAEGLVSLAAFVVVASLTIAAPIVATLAIGPRSAPILQRSREWLERHGNAAVAVVLFVLGVLVAFDAARGL